MREWEQPHYTCEWGGARSRIDRIRNQHISYQLDRHISCSVLEWCQETSAHRPLCFSRRTPSPKCQEGKPIPLADFERKGWLTQVEGQFRYLGIDDANIDNPIRKLVLIKDAIRNIYGLNSKTGISFNLSQIALMRTSST